MAKQTSGTFPRRPRTPKRKDVRKLLDQGMDTEETVKQLQAENLGVVGIMEAVENGFRWMVWSWLWGAVVAVILAGALGYHMFFQH